MNIPEHLIDYLKHHDSAELLTFGTFYANDVPSTFDLKSRSLTPPARTLAFRTTKINDTRFVEYIATQEFISVNTAKTLMKQYATSLSEQLIANGRHHVGNLGIFSCKSGNDYQFSADRSLNLLDETFAFVPLHDVKIFEPAVATESDIVSSQTVIESEYNTAAVEIPSVEVAVEPVCEIEHTTPSAMAIEPANNAAAETVAIKEEPEQEPIPTEEPRFEQPLADNAESVTAVEPPTEETPKREAAEKVVVKPPKRKKEKHHHGQYSSKRRRGWIIFFILLILLGIATFFATTPIASEWIIDLKTKWTAEPQTEMPIAVPAVVEEEEPLALEENDTMEAAEPTPSAELKKETPSPKTTLPPTLAKPIIPKTIHQQDFSRKGFDVIGGSYASLANAEDAAKKAFAQGFQSYLIAKIQKGNHVYFVSYGSYRTLAEANDNLQMVIAKTGSTQYYVKSF